MKKILILILTIALSLIPTASALPADELIYEAFDNWKNPYVAEGWKTHSVGGWGGEFNQIYEAGQEMTTGPGDSIYYRSIYKDFEVKEGEEYSVTYESRGSEFKTWLQFWDKEDRLLLTMEGLGISFSYLDRFFKQWAPNERKWWGGSKRNTQSVVVVPPLAKRMRLVFQAKPNSVVQLRRIALHQRDPMIEPEFGFLGHVGYAWPLVEGPFINWNTEFSGGVSKGFGTYTFGKLAGEYNIKPVGSSAQGISCGGNSFEENKHIYRDFKITGGKKYKLSVDVISNSTNFLGTRNPSPVRIWIQYNGIDYNGREKVLATHGIDGTQAGIKMDGWTTVTVPGPNGEPYTIAPERANRARIILQVMGGTGGGTIFDNVSFTRDEG